MARSRSGSGRRSSRPQPAAKLPFRLEDVAAAGFVLLAVLLGGASAGGFAGNAVLQFVSVLAIAWGIATLEWLPERKGERVPLLFALALLALILVQLIPLPPELWSRIPGRDRVVEGLSAIGVNPLPWMPLSLYPSRTLAGVTAMLPPIAALVLVLRLNRDSAQSALWALFAAAVASVVLGLGQLSGGLDSPLYFYAITNFGAAVGFFSNSNHLATLMLMVLPLVAGVAVRARIRSDETGGATVAWIAAPAVALLALLGVLAAGSLAGILLAPIALAGGFLVFRSMLSWRAQLWLIGGGLLVVAAAVSVVLLSPATLDFGTTNFGSAGMSRSHMWSISSVAAQAMLPLGSGFGSFDAVFRQFENPATVGSIYANHAHSDMIELVIEGGVASGLLLLAFLFWYLRRLWKLWLSYGTRDPIACAASVAVGLVLLHSLVDYPLRTSAIAVAFALCLGLMARSPRQTASIAAEAPSARHLSV
jgi:O-antigen ligase